MIFKDLINSVNYNDVWVELRKGYKLKKSAYETYKKVLEELKTTAEYANLEEVMAKLKYVDKRTLKEKEKEYKECAKIAVKNKKVYKMLFGK